ncbi:MAG: diguanylate cyclase [Spirochaetaceae bacterium]|nr:diguanylate cyclase [Spirochaetaceae bacterium]
MKPLTILILFSLPLFIFSQENRKDDFYFSSIEEEIVALNNKARKTDEDHPSDKLQLAREAYELSVAEDLYTNQADALATMGTAYLNLLEIDKSLESLTKSYELSKRIDYSEGLWYSAFYLGILHNFLEDFEKAEAFYKEADLLISSENDMRHIQVYRELAKLYKNQKLYKKAVSMISDALYISETLNDIQSTLELNLLSGEIHFNSGNIRIASSYLNNIINQTSAVGDYQNIRASAMSLMGKCYALLGNFPMALAYGQDALLLSVKNSFGSGRLDAYDSLSFIYQYMDDYEKAYFYLQTFYKQKELLEKEKSTSSLNRIKAYYGTFEKDQEIDKQQQQIETQKRLILAGSLFIALFIILILVFYLLYKKNSRIAEKLTREMKKEMVLSRTDPVTGLPNRKDMEGLIQNAITRWKKENIDFSLLFISLETYSKIDREWGEGSGEDLQRFASRIMQVELKGRDRISVWKPFLFLILLPETDRESLKTVIHKLHLKFSKIQYVYEGKETTLSVKSGSYTYSREDTRSNCIERCREELDNSST